MLRQLNCRSFFVILLMVMLLPRWGWAQARLNLELEADANRRQPLLLWSRQASPGVTVQFDTLTRAQGRSSLQLELPAAEAGQGEEDVPYAQLYTLFAFPVDSVRGHRVTVSATVRTQNFVGQAGVYAYAHTPDEDGKNRTDNVTALPPDQPWRRIDVDLPVKATATAFGLGLRVSGHGHIWFDQIEVRIDGHVFQDEPQPVTEALLLTPKELQATTWDFEQLPPPSARPAPDVVGLALDSAQPQQGHRSWAIALKHAPRPNMPLPVVYLGTLPVAQLRGKLLTVTGYWKQGSPVPSLGNNAPDYPTAVPRPPVFTYTLLGNDGRPGTPPQWTRTVVELPTTTPALTLLWTAFTLTIPVPNDEFLYGVSLGVRPTGRVPFLLDNIQFRLDGRPYVPAKLSAAAPTAPEIAWLRKALVPLPTTMPLKAADEPAGLGALIGNAQIVGLGEVTHGSGSIFQMKHRLIRYLIEQKAFAAFVLETSADCAPLNAYLQTGEGDVAGLLKGLGVWNTQEVAALVRYLRAYNQSHGVKIQLAGMDMQRPDLALARLKSITPASDDFALSQLKSIETTLAQMPGTGGGIAFDLFKHPNQPDDPLLQTLLQLIQELRTGLDTRSKLVRASDQSAYQLASYLHDLRLVEQGAIFRRTPLARAAAYRDACMAENVTWLRQHLGSNGTSVKLAVWVHNAHVALTSPYQPPMGEWLKNTFGGAYLAIGFAFGEGTYTAEGAGAFHTAKAEPARAGTYEAWFQAAKVPAFLLDMRPLKPGKEGGWLFQQQLLRDIGIQESARNFALHELPKEFDAVLYLQSSTAAQRLK